MVVKNETFDELAHIENVMGVLHDDTLADPVINIARQALSGSAVEAELEDELSERTALEEALERAEERLLHWEHTDDLENIARGHWAVALAHLALSDADAALEHFQIAAEMAEAQGDVTTQAWALAFHGLTKMSQFEMLQDEGEEEIEEAKRLLEETDNMLGVSAIHERVRRMRF